MKATDIQIGMQVRLIGETDLKCVVEALPDDNGYCVVRFSNTSDSERIHISDLKSADLKYDLEKALQAQTHINKATNALEEAFSAMQDLHGIKDLFDLRANNLIDFSELEEVVEKFGWSSSSLHC